MDGVKIRDMPLCNHLLERIHLVAREPRGVGGGWGVSEALEGFVTSLVGASGES